MQLCVAIGLALLGAVSQLILILIVIQDAWSFDTTVVLVIWVLLSFAMILWVAPLFALIALRRVARMHGRSSGRVPHTVRRTECLVITRITNNKCVTNSMNCAVFICVLFCFALMMIYILVRCFVRRTFSIGGAGCFGLS